MNGEQRRVVAGVSSVDYRLPMIRWAAGEAAARGAELRLVTAVPPRAVPEEYLPAERADALRSAARARLAAAAELATTDHPGLFVTTEIADGAPVDVLRDAASKADLLVVGEDDQSPFAEAITGSVPGALLTLSPCPLAVVPHTKLSTRDGAPVLAALDEPGTSRAAMAYAFAAADRFGRSLVLLRCLPVGGHDHTVPADQAQALLGFRELYPHIEVTEAVAPGDPRDVLAERSRGAALLVLGSRGRGRLASTLFGSVSRDLVRRSGCPVVIARPQAAYSE